MQQSLPNARIHALKHSTWITASWDWLMELIGRSAEAILVASVLYQSVKLLPVVHMPASLDVIAFIAQFVALDVGGLSLGKLAKQARSEGNTEGATQAGRMSNALITVMIAGVVVVAVEQLFPIPDTWKLGIDTILLIARSILAVLYGHIIHTLKQEVPFDQAQPHGQPDMQAHLSWSLVALAATQQEQLATSIGNMQAQFEQRLATIQDTQAHMPALDFETLNEAVTRQIEATSEAKFASFLRQSEALFEAKMRQRITVSEVPMRQQIEAPKPRREAVNEASKPPQNVVPMRQSGTDKRAAVYQLADKDTSASSYEISEKTGVPVSTVQRYLRERREAESEATGTDQ